MDRPGLVPIGAISMMCCLQACSSSETDDTLKDAGTGGTTTTDTTTATTATGGVDAGTGGTTTTDTTTATTATGGVDAGTGGTTATDTATATGGVTNGAGGSATASTCSVTVEGSVGNFLDGRDSQTYSCVVIGTQTWMAQNLNYGTLVLGSVEQTAVGDKYCVSDDESFCDYYGGLYQSAIADSSCPTGWHLPTSSEWQTMTSYVGSNGSQTCPADTVDNTTNCVGYDLKSSLAGSWATNPDSGDGGPGLDRYGWNGLGGGARYYVGYTYASDKVSDDGFAWAPSSVGGRGMRGIFWAASTAKAYHLGDDRNAIANVDSAELVASYGFSVRCVQD